jgi:hypothetical protein
VPNVVTGISPDGNVDALTRALKAARISLEPLQILGPEAAAHTVAGGGLVDTGRLLGGGLETGTGVPGLTGSGVPGIGLEPVPEVDGNSIWEQLSDLEIPDDELENYAEALEAGRSIVAYPALSSNVRAVESAFAAAGLAKVRTF